jgi:hypothetical protein
MNWFFSLIDISLATANKFYTFGWAASFSGAAITLVGVAFLMWGTRVRDQDFEHNVASLHERAAEANRQAADANRQAKEAELALAKFRAPRLPTEVEFALLKSRIERFAGTQFDAGMNLDREVQDFLWRLEPVLWAAGWQQVDWIGPPGSQYGQCRSDRRFAAAPPSSTSRSRCIQRASKGFDPRLKLSPLGSEISGLKQEPEISTCTTIIRKRFTS